MRVRFCVTPHATDGCYLISKYLIYDIFILLLLMASSQPVDGSGRLPTADEPVIVVGGGLAGLSAAIEVVSAGHKVIVVDMEKDVGGNSAKASSGINGAGTPTQKTMGIDDNPDRLYADTMTAGDRANNPLLVDKLVHNSVDAVDFLIENGVPLNDVNLCGGHSKPRTHWIPSPKEGKPLPVGVAIIRALKQKLADFNEKQPGSVTMRTGAQVFGMVTWNDYITGVRVIKDGERDEISGKAVILTTGGFSNDHDNDSLLSEFAPEKLSFPTTNGAFARGLGVKMARAMGAQLIDMQHVQIHPTAFIDPKAPDARTKFLAAEALRGKGAILLNAKGKRIGNELGRRDYLTKQIMEKGAVEESAGKVHVAYMVMNDKSVDDFGWPAFNFYWKIKGFFTKVDNMGQMAAHLKADEEALAKTLTDYNKSFESQSKDDFGKTVFPVAFDHSQPMYVAMVTPAIHYTMGGLKIDPDARVINEESGEPIVGLYAAGEVTGGVHGKNRLAGNSLLECVVFGRIAGQQAAALSHNTREDL